jgi:hypothetical protein
MRCRSGNGEKLVSWLGCICHAGILYQSVGSGLLSPFRFSRIDRLKITALRLMLPSMRAYRIIVLSFGYRRPFEDNHTFSS